MLMLMHAQGCLCSCNVKVKCMLDTQGVTTCTSTDSSTTMGIPLGRLPTRFHRHNLSCMYGSWSVVTSHSPQRQDVFKPLSWSLASQESQSWSKLSYSITCIGHKWIMGRDLSKPLDALVSQELNQPYSSISLRSSQKSSTHAWMFTTPKQQLTNPKTQSIGYVAQLAECPPMQRSVQ